MWISKGVNNFGVDDRAWQKVVTYVDVQDLVYLLLGYLLEILFLSNDNDNHTLSFETTFYLTHMDIAIGNTFITTSGFIILLLTIDRLETK